MNLLAEVQKGLKGLNQGLHFYSHKLNRYLGGIHPFYYVIAAASKAGKTSFVDLNVILGPYLAKEHEDIEWHYFSTEISRIAKEAKLIACLAYIKHKVKIDADLILGRKRDHTGSPLLMNAAQQAIVEDIYKNDIIPLFGEFDETTGKQITPGRIKFYPGRYSPTQIRELLFAVASKNGTFTSSKVNVVDAHGKFVEKEIVTGYVPSNNKRIIVIVDHMRGIKREPGIDRKSNIDKLSEHFVDIRDWFKFSIFGVIHLNRSITNIERIKLHRETLYPTDEDLKDSGNPVEDCDVLLTAFNPSDEAFAITTHFSHKVEDYNGKLRTVHIVRARNTECPLHIPMLFEGAAAHFEDLAPPTTGAYGTIF